MILKELLILDKRDITRNNEFSGNRIAAFIPLLSRRVTHKNALECFRI